MIATIITIQTIGTTTRDIKITTNGMPMKTGPTACTGNSSIMTYVDWSHANARQQQAYWNWRHNHSDAVFR